jgi:hypothetical protein
MGSIHEKNQGPKISCYCTFKWRENPQEFKQSLHWRLGIGIEETNASIGIRASIILVRCRTKKIPDCLGLVLYRTIPGIVSFFSPAPD